MQSSTDILDGSPGGHIILEKLEDGRYRATMLGTPLRVVGTDERIVMEEMNRRIDTFARTGNPGQVRWSQGQE